MNAPNLPTGRRRLGDLDVTLARIALVVSVLSLGLRLVASEVLLLVIPLATATGSAVYLATANERPVHAVRPTLSGRVADLLPALVVVGVAGLVILVHVVGRRTPAVYLLTGAIGVAILGQILLVDEDRVAVGPVLFQVLAAAVAIRLSALYATPGYVGMDIWTHATVFVDGIAREGSLAPLAESKYLLAPVYHVVGAVGALVLGGPRNGIYLAVGLAVTLSGLFVYATGRLLLPARWALLATALYAFSDQFVRWGMHVIPTSLGLAFFLAAVYAATRLLAADAERWAVALLAVASLGTVFTHQVSTAVVLVFLAVATAVTTVLAVFGTDVGRNAARKAVALAGVSVLTLVTTVVSWANAPFGGESTFLWRELSVVGAALTDSGLLNLAGEGGDPTAGGAATTPFTPLVPYVELVGFGLLLAAAVVGGLLLLGRDLPPDVALTHVATAGVLFVAVFGLSLFGMRALLPGRWLAFLYVPLALLAGAGLHQVSRHGSRRLALAAFLVLALGYPTTMVVAEKATLDSPAFGTEHKRFAYTEAELGAARTAPAVAPAEDGAALGTDHPYVGVFRRFAGYEGATVLVIGADGPTGAEVAVARDYQSTGPATVDRPEGFDGGTDEGPLAAAVCPVSWSVAYANDEVLLCTAPPDAEGEA